MAKGVPGRKGGKARWGISDLSTGRVNGDRRGVYLVLIWDESVFVESEFSMGDVEEEECRPWRG